MLFQHFSNIATDIMVVVKMSDQHFNVSLFSNPGDKVLILVKSRGQIFPLVSHFFRTLSPGFENNDKPKCWFSIFSSNPDLYGYVGKLAEQNFDVWLFSNQDNKTLILVEI